MLYQKTGLPVEDEFVLCTVTNVQYNSVFCNLDEYPGKSGMIHISEVTAGRIRNIREYVQEGRKVVCKVLRVDEAKGHIDLSLRRVNERQRIEKNAALKQELKAENLLAYLAKEHKKEPKAFYDSVAPKILEKYDYLHEAFQDIVEGTFSLSSVGVDKKISGEIEQLVKERIKPIEVSIEGVFEITTYAPNGVEHVRKSLTEARDKSPADVRYLGGGKYKITVSAEDYKAAEERLKNAVDIIEGTFEKIPTSTVTFTREE